MKNGKLLSSYLLLDFLSAAISWGALFLFRKLYIEPQIFGYSVPVHADMKLISGLIIVPSFWLTLYFISGYYSHFLRKSRLNDTVITFLQTFTGVLIIFFFLILDDYVRSYRSYYLITGFLFVSHFSFTLLFRLIITSVTVNRIKKRKAGFPTIIIGGNGPALRVLRDLNNQKYSSGNIPIGFVTSSSGMSVELSRSLPCLGNTRNIKRLVHQYNAEEVIFALDKADYNEVNSIINELSLTKVIIKAVPEMYTLFSGRSKPGHLYGPQLISLSRELMPPWQENIKNISDKVLSVLALGIASPLMLVISIGIKLTSPGPVIYSHERIGRYGKPFRLYKFRSMYVGAEKNGPELTTRNDTRLTGFGKFLRKFRLDEIPNFFNVILGDMSIVGPRPERKYFIRKIIKIAPHYVNLQRVKPGITSWGQVKYGYAENVEQMVNRLSYDMMYIENMSLFTDFKILFYTFLTIIRGRGI